MKRLPGKLHSLPRALTFLVILAAGQFVRADLITTDPRLPATNGTYRTPADVHAQYNGGGLSIILKRAEHRPFADQAQRQIVGPDEQESFPSSFAGTADVYQSGIFLTETALQGQGPVITIVHGKAGQTTGTWNTEMLSMNLSVNTVLGPFMIRESPTLPSLGRTTITDLGGGRYRISSYFDLFTELSLDGGASWFPSSSSTRVVLEPQPTMAVRRTKGRVEISWPAEFSDFALEAMPNLMPAGTWSAVTNAPVTTNQTVIVTVDADSPKRFFRLRKR